MGYINIVGLRPRTDVPDKVYDVYFKIKADNIRALFDDVNGILKQIPKTEHWNLFYTVAECTEGTRVLEHQNILPFDVDGIGESPVEEVAQAVCDALGVEYGDCIIVGSGNGVHVLVGMEKGFKDKKYFDDNRDAYKYLCDKINETLGERELSGKADTSVFSHARILRLPGTRNIKKDKPETHCVVINSDITFGDFSLEGLLSSPDVKKEDQVSPAEIKKFGIIDTDAVLDCLFIKEWKDNPNELTEPEWYAMLSIVGRLKEGDKLAHEYSKGHRKYKPSQTNLKLRQALTKSGPRTCKSIEKLWSSPKCHECKFFGKSKSPICNRNETFLITKDTGFWEVKTSVNANTGVEKTVPVKPCYEDLAKHYGHGNIFMYLTDLRDIYTYASGLWSRVEDDVLLKYAYENFNPKPLEHQRKEFIKVLQLQKQASSHLLRKNTSGKMAFKNGVMNVETFFKDFKLEPHNPDNFFTNIIDCDLPEGGEAIESLDTPVFDKFMEEVTCGRSDLQETLLQFIGYALSNDYYWEHKALMLYGKTRNGKSTFLKLVTRLIGESNYASVNLDELKDPANRFLLVSKPLGISWETPFHSLKESTVFKTITSGDEMLVKELYKQPITVRATAKLIFSCNELPTTKSSLAAVKERLVIIPFDADFSSNADKFMDSRFEAEVPQIILKCALAYGRMKRDGRLFIGDDSKQMLEQFDKESNPMWEWIESNFDVLEGESVDSNYVSVLEIYSNYVRFCENSRVKPLESTMFARNLIEMVPKLKERIVRKRAHGRGNPVKCYWGVKLQMNHGDMS